MSDYYNVTTNVGDVAIATAIANATKLDITHIAFGDGNGSVPTPNKSRTSLVNEVHRQAVTKYARHATIANYILIETIIPPNIGGFWIREIGIIAGGVLISHGSHAPFFKVADPDGVSEYRLKFTQDVRDGSVVEIMLDESLIYATQAWVDENYIPRDELVDNLTSNDSTKPLSAKQGKNLQDNKLDKNDNATSASKLNISRKINNVDFDGTRDITIYDATKLPVNANPTYQGAYASWNRNSGQGRFDLISHKGAGQGGFEFWVTDGTTISSVAVISPTGAYSGNAATASKLTTASGSAPSYAARAWVNFNGQGTVAINASGNVSSITDNGAGIYTINFTTAMPHANYAWDISGRDNDSGGDVTVGARSTDTKTTSALQVVTGAGSTRQDFPEISVVIFC